MNFYKLYKLISENTVEQELKKYDKKLVEKLINLSFQKLNKYFRVQNRLSRDSMLVLARWLAFNALADELSIELDDPDKPDLKTLLNFGINDINQYSDFLTHSTDPYGNLNQDLINKFNSIDFDIDSLSDLNDQYHINLYKKIKKIPGRDGKIIISFPDGYKWVDIEKIYCDIESRSMGHCGNRGGKQNDTILSLRDDKNIPHLTFILNNKSLGQMKGRGNSKPSKKYHKYIIELLKLPIIRKIEGGGYKPENNFKLSDLTEDQLKDLIKFNPWMKIALKNEDKKMVSPQVDGMTVANINTYLNRLLGEN